MPYDDPMQQQFLKQYLGKFPEAPLYEPRCLNCHETIEVHAPSNDGSTRGHCLFDSTRWDPMTEEEYGVWRKEFWLREKSAAGWVTTGRLTSNPPYIK